MNGPPRLRDGSGPAERLLSSADIDQPSASARKRALVFAASAIALTATGTAGAATGTAGAATGTAGAATGTAGAATGTAEAATGTAGAATGTAGAATGAATGSGLLLKSVALCVCLGAVGGGGLALTASNVAERLSPPAAASAPRVARATAQPAPASRPAEPRAPERVPAASDEDAPRSPAAPVQDADIAKSDTSKAPPARSPRAVGAATSREAFGGQPKLFEELRLIEQARGAVGRRDAAKALTILEQYDRTYPGGQFEPEAMALRIQALSQRGEARRALSLATLFRQRYPRHPLLSHVEAVVGR